MEYRIVMAESGESAYCGKFKLPAEAEAVASGLRAGGHKVRIAVVVTNEWREREAGKFEVGAYDHLPVSWRRAPWFVGSVADLDHYAHMSADGLRVSYTESPEKGMADKQLVLDPGKYLARYFGAVLSSEQIKRLATGFTGAGVLVRFAGTPDEIVEVYAGHNVSAGGSSGRSCMSYRAEQFHGPVHPAHVYGAGDLAVAYVRDGAAIASRVLVHTEERTYGRVYGRTDSDCRALTDSLEADGWTRTGAFDGARLLRIVYNGAFVAPYIDGDIQTVRDNGAFLVITSQAPYDANNTNGLTNKNYRWDRHCAASDIVADDDSRYCEHCDRDRNPEDGQEVGGEWWCESCVSSDAFCCRNCSEYHSDDARCSVDNESWCESCRESDAQFCARCDEYVSSYTTQVGGHQSDEYYCAYCLRHAATRCDSCGEYHPDSDVKEVTSLAAGEFKSWCVSCRKDGGLYCEECDTWREACKDSAADAEALGMCGACAVLAYGAEEVESRLVYHACATDPRQGVLPLPARPAWYYGAGDARQSAAA